MYCTYEYLYEKFSWTREHVLTCSILKIFDKFVIDLWKCKGNPFWLTELCVCSCISSWKMMELINILCNKHTSQLGLLFLRACHGGSWVQYDWLVNVHLLRWLRLSSLSLALTCRTTRACVRVHLYVEASRKYDVVSFYQLGEIFHLRS